MLWEQHQISIVVPGQRSGDSIEGPSLRSPGRDEAIWEICPARPGRPGRSSGLRVFGPLGLWAFGPPGPARPTGDRALDASPGLAVGAWHYCC